MKRTREEASVQAERASSLSATLKELEELKTSDSVKAARISELEQLCNDRQYAAEKLQDELARAGILKDKFDFSKLSSREMINTAPRPRMLTRVLLITRISLLRHLTHPVGLMTNSCRSLPKRPQTVLARTGLASLALDTPILVPQRVTWMRSLLMRSVSPNVCAD